MRTTSITIPSLFTALAAATAAGSPPTYRVEFLGAGWTATGLNERGDACGSISPDGTSLLAGVSRDGRPFELLPLPAGMQTSRAFAINDAGVIVGAVCPNQYVITQPTAAVWRPVEGGYQVEVLQGLTGHPYSAAYSVNNLGDIVGGSGYFGWNLSSGVLFAASGVVQLPAGFLGGDINDRRVVMSASTLLDLDTGETVPIPLPPGVWQGFQPADLNNNNDFCGYIAGFSGCSTFPIRHRAGSWEFLGGCGSTTSATALNDLGDALTYYYFAATGVHFVDEGYFMLGALIDPSQGPWAVQPGGANGINNARQIIAAAREGASGPIGAVRLTPMTAACPGDFNGDGFIDFFDYDDFVNCFETASCPPGRTADFNGDGFADFFDYDDFLLAFEGGC